MAQQSWYRTAEEQQRNKRLIEENERTKAMIARDRKDVEALEKVKEKEWNANAKKLEQYRKQNPDIADKQGQYNGVKTTGYGETPDHGGQSSLDAWLQDRGGNTPDPKELLQQHQRQKEERARLAEEEVDRLVEEERARLAEKERQAELRRGEYNSREEKKRQQSSGVGTSTSRDHNGHAHSDYRYQDMETYPVEQVPSPRHSHNQSHVTMNAVSPGYHHSTHPVGQVQAQRSVQQQRSLQASLQMAYSVFGNVITALETFEERENKKYRHPKQRRSNISIPDQSRKSDSDVTACLEAQLRVFETHMKVCQQEIKGEAIETMIPLLVDWLATRGSTKTIPPTATDHFASMLFEILVKGSTQHDEALLKNKKVFGKAELMSNVGKVIRGQMKADDLDRSFHDDPRKKADVPDVRRGGKFNEGLRRLELCNASLSRYTKEWKEPTAR